MLNTCKSNETLPSGGCSSGERVSNTWATCPRLWDNSKKLGLIPDMTADRMVENPDGVFGKRGLFTMLRRREELAGYQLVGEVMAHQGYDGYGV